MKNFLLLLFCCLFLIPSFGQDRAFAFVNKANGKTAQKAVPAYKQKTAQKVFNDLVAGQGDFSRKTPKLVMNDDEVAVAWAQPEDFEICLEETAYDICASFGADSLNALAALLAHELVHYYEKHEWRRYFIQENADLSSAQQLERLEEKFKLEVQADYLGGFMAHAVGYDVHGIMPVLLNKIYSKEGYELDDEIPGYPSRQERIEMSKKAMERLSDLLVVFETATYLQLLENYEMADRYYEYVLRDFQSRELYNNAGVNTLHASLELFTKEELPYALPVEMDPETRLRRPNTRNSDRERKEKREELILQARGYFKQAIALDEHYVPAYINMAITFLLLEDWDKADIQLSMAASENPGPKMASDIEVVKGVIDALQENLGNARDHWQSAQEDNSHLAEINLKIADGGTPAAVNPVQGFVMKREQIADISLDQFLRSTGPDRMVQVDKSEDITAGFYQRENYLIYSHAVAAAREFMSVQLVDESFTGKSLEGIQIGDTREKLLEAYKTPERQVQTPQGEFLVYPQRQLFFRLDAEAKVVGWGIYRML
jgi:hypothetical protein